MIPAVPPLDESARLAVLLGYGVLDTPPDPAFDAITASAARICGAPIALISLVDASRQWFKSHYGLAAQETPRRDSFCAHALQRTDVFVVPDATLDERFADNPLVLGEPHIRYYAGAPLVTEQGQVLGTLCVIDTVPRQLDAGQIDTLRALARHVVSLLELRRIGVPLQPGPDPAAAPAAGSAAATVRRRLVTAALVIAVIALAAMATVAAASLFDMRSMARAATDQRRLLLQARSVLAALQDAETGQRGFLLTGEERYLVPYLRGRDEVEGHIAAIEQLEGAGDARRFDTATLRPLIRTKLDELAQTIELRRSQGEAAALAVVKAGSGKAAMDRIRVLLGSEEARITDQLEDRSRRVQSSSARALAGFMIGGALSVALLLLASIALRREVRLHERTAQSLREANAAVEHQVRERTGELVQANAALRERSEYLRHIGDNLPGGVVFQTLLLADGTRSFRYVSAGVQQVHGLSVQAALADATLLYRQFAKPEQARMREVELAALASGTTFDIEASLQRADGATRWVRLVSTPTPQGDGSVLWDGIELDITERRQADAAVHVLNAQLRQDAAELEQRVLARTAELAEARDRAESADRMKSAFLATMSHELRTPLNSIIGFTGILLQRLAGPLNDEQHKQLDMVRGSARHLLALINDVLDISKIEAGELQVMNRPFDLAASIAKVTAIVRPLAEAKGLALDVEVGAGVGRLAGDARRVEQVLLNLLSNAIKFTAVGSVTLQAVAVPAQAAVRIAVTDTGIGVRPEQLDTLFRPFRQIDSALSRQHDGTGLGLAISQRLAALMGGGIEVESQWEQGSRFTLTLPLNTGAAA